MDSTTLDAAERDFGIAMRALEVLRRIGPVPDSQNSPAALDAWSSLLTHGKRVFNKLEQGAKKSAGKNWYANIVHETRTDELLIYMRQARDAEEHGTARIAEVEHASVHLSMSTDLPEGTVILKLPPPGGDMFNLCEAGHPTVKITKKVPRRVVLSEVRNRNVTYKVPTEHLGLPIFQPNFIVLGELYIGYLQRVLEIAKSFKA